MNGEVIAPPPAVEPLPVDTAIAEAKRRVKDEISKLRFLRKHRAKLAALDAKPTFSGDRLDFDNLPHEKVIAVVKAIGGKWSKTPADLNRIHYESKEEFDGFRVRCWQGEPPPSCKIIEVEEHIPEQIIPASVRKVKKMVCHPEFAAVIATARQASPPQ